MASASPSSSTAMSPTSPSPPKQSEEEQDIPAPSDGDEEEEEEEEEPQLKYERVGGDIAKVVRGDLVSTFCVGSKVIVYTIPSSELKIDVFQAIGSHNGKIYLFDLKGNELRRVKAHTASISDLSLDKTSDYLASASIDGIKHV